MKRNIYLSDIPLDEAQAAFRAALSAAGLDNKLDVATVPVADALNRVTAEAIFARLSSPHYHASAMDGFAIRAADTVGATETRPLAMTLVDEDSAVKTVTRPAQPVNTGQPLPNWANAVVMVEHTQPTTLDNQNAIQIRAAIPPWHHVRPMGEDMVATELVLPANHRLRPVDLGALIGCGHTHVRVTRKPRVAIIPTGSELVALEQADPAAGQIIEYNSVVLAAQVTQWGGLPTRWPIVPDEVEALISAVAQAAHNHDLILLNAGSSAGTTDYTAHVVGELGRVLVHGVAVRPGHPVILGMVKRGQSAGDQQEVPIIGVPGYPVSAALTGEIFVEPLLARWLGRKPISAETIRGTLTRKTSSPIGDDDFVRVAVGQVGERTMVTPIHRGAGVITSLVRADGILPIPRFSEGHNAGDSVTVQLYRSRETIARTIVAIGSHDLCLDLMAQFLAESGEVRLSSAHVGSLGGLMALRRGEAHLAGCHLLDPASGTYNLPDIERYLPNVDVAVVGLVGREQGWMVARDNPLELSGWEDAANPALRFVNRQRGAGTRVLLDYHLARLGIDSAEINGYAREEYTHLAVAAAVASGSADAGLGIRAAADALDLDFVPLATEAYDLVIPQVHLDSGVVQPVLDLLENEAFISAVGRMPGYDTSRMGKWV